MSWEGFLLVKKQETDSRTVKPDKRTVHRGIFRILIQMRESGRESSFILGSSDKKCILSDSSSALGSWGGDLTSIAGHSLSHRSVCHSSQKAAVQALIPAQCWVMRKLPASSTEEASTLHHSLACLPQVRELEHSIEDLHPAVLNVRNPSQSHTSCVN